MENASKIDKVTKCLVCRNKTALFSIKKNDFDLYRCSNCALLFVYPMPDDTSYVYSTDYFSGATKGFGYVDYEQDKSAMAEVFGLYLDNIEHIIKRKGRILDVGAANGFFMNLARMRGWEVYGIEISDYAASEGRSKDLNIITGTLKDISDRDGFFDVVTLWDVIEHLPDPEDEIIILNKIVKPGGLLAINTPDSSSFFAKIMGRRWHLLVPPEHLVYFSPKTLRIFLEKYGFDLEFQSKIGKSFTMRYVFNILSNWQGLSIWRHMVGFLNKSKLGGLQIPINLHDNFFAIYKKISD